VGVCRVPEENLGDKFLQAFLYYVTQPTVPKCRKELTPTSGLSDLILSSSTTRLLREGALLPLYRLSHTNATVTWLAVVSNPVLQYPVVTTPAHSSTKLDMNVSQITTSFVHCFFLISVRLHEDLLRVQKQTLMKASMSPTAGMKSGINGRRRYSNSMFWVAYLWY